MVFIFLFIVFAFNVIQIVAAFGGTMVAMPFSILLMGAERSRVILNAVSLYSCAFPVIKWHSNINWKQVRIIVCFMSLGLLVSLSFLKDYSSSFEALLCYGLFIVMVALERFLSRNKEQKQFPILLDYCILFLAGLVHGLFLSGGALLILYATNHLRDNNEFRSTISVIWLLINGSLFVLSISKGQMVDGNLKLFVLSTIPAILGIAVGYYLQKHINKKQFAVFVNALLLLSGLILVVNSLKGLI